MSDLVAKAIATIGEGNAARDIVVYEITPVQMREVLMNTGWPGDNASNESLARYQVDQILFEDCSLTDLAMFTRLPIGEIEAIPPSQLRKLLDKAKEINPDFFAALGRLAKRQSGH